MQKAQNAFLRNDSEGNLRLAGIGTKNESSLHKTLKFQYTGLNGQVEAEAGEFVTDGIRQDGEYIEVQTGSFAPLRKKIKALSGSKKNVRIIHPIAVNKYIEVYKKELKHYAAVPLCEHLLHRRKSPKKGSLWSLFDALIHAPELALLPGVTIEVVLADITEIRVKDGKGSWRRKGISIKDRKIKAWHESVVFKNPKDYLSFVPFKKSEEFTVATLANRACIKTDTARLALYALTKMGIVKRIGKQGHAWVYTRAK